LIVLALDTALSACSVGLFDAERDKVVASETALLGRGHAEALLPMLERVVAKLDRGWAAVSRIGVIVGPGSFTGLRVGIAAARAAALATKRPALGITTLEALAAPVIAISEGMPVATVIDARHSNVFFQLFCSEGRPLCDPVVLSVDEVAARLVEQPVHLVGTSSSAVRAALSQLGATTLTCDADAVPDIVYVAKLVATADPLKASPTPLYLRAAAARPIAEQASA
jgi:tRNA threonylcarbamoyladenosine biosynthesis protein TsaB